MRMAEKSDGAVVFTTDSDFRTYRKNGGQVTDHIQLGDAAR